MEEIKNNKLAWIVGVLLIVNVFCFLSTIFVDKAADRAIEKLQMDYSPAKPPYGPGLNPDRVIIEHKSGAQYPVSMPQLNLDMVHARDAMWRQNGINL